MGSVNASRVVGKINERVRKGQIVSVSKIMEEVGYSKTSSQALKVTKTKAYANLTRPIIDGLLEQINKIKNEIASRDLSQEETKLLVGTLDIYIKNYQLLSGGATSREVFMLPSEVIQRNDITIKSIDDVPKLSEKPKEG